VLCWVCNFAASKKIVPSLTRGVNRRQKSFASWDICFVRNNACVHWYASKSPSVLSLAYRRAKLISCFACVDRLRDVSMRHRDILDLCLTECSRCGGASLLFLFCSPI
jgi:hypothetical protein